MGIVSSHRHPHLPMITCTHAAPQPLPCPKWRSRIRPSEFPAGRIILIREDDASSVSIAERDRSPRCRNMIFLFDLFIVFFVLQCTLGRNLSPFTDAFNCMRALCARWLGESAERVSTRVARVAGGKGWHRAVHCAVLWDSHAAHAAHSSRQRARSSPHPRPDRMRGGPNRRSRDSGGKCGTWHHSCGTGRDQCTFSRSPIPPLHL
jgi:hypothetical protein